MPCRTMGAADADYAVCCAVPLDAEGLTIAARPAGRPGENAAKFSARYGQSTGVLMFDDVFVPWDKVFLAGEHEWTGPLVTSYATHHRHSCIAARAGFGDLLIGAGVMMAEANGVPAEKFSHIRGSLVDLIKIVEGFYACGVASSVYGKVDPSGVAQPDDVFANIGKLLLSTQIYDMHRLAHEVSGGLIVALPGPDEDHNPATGADLAKALTANPAVKRWTRLSVQTEGGALVECHDAVLIEFDLGEIKELRIEVVGIAYPKYEELFPGRFASYEASFDNDET